MRWIFEKTNSLEGEYRRGLGNGFYFGIVLAGFLALLVMILSQ